MEPSIEGPLAPAIDEMLDRLDATHAWLAELDAERRDAQSRVDRLRLAISAAAHLLPARARDVRLTRLQTGEKRLRGGPAGRTPRARAVRAFLAAYEGETFHVSQLQKHLTDRGLADDPRAAARSLSKLSAEGRVSRTRLGVYRITPPLVSDNERESD